MVWEPISACTCVRLKGSLCLCCIYINAMLPASEHWRVHLSSGFSSCKWTLPFQISNKHWKCEQRQSFWFRQGQKQSFYHRAHAFVISLRGVFFWFQGCSVMNKVSDERSQHRARYTKTLSIIQCCTAPVSCSHRNAMLVALRNKYHRK